MVHRGSSSKPDASPASLTFWMNKAPFVQWMQRGFYDRHANTDWDALMTRSRFFLCVGLSAVAALLWFARASRTRPPISRARLQTALKVGFQVGEYAPDFVLRSVDGSRLRLSDLRGKPVLVNFWATWCAPCKVEMPWLVQLNDKYRDQRLRIIGVAMESGSAEEVAAFARQRGVGYQIVLGDSATADKYGGVRFMPQSFFIDGDGKITRVTTGLTDKKDLEDGIRALLRPQSINESSSESWRSGIGCSPAAELILGWSYVAFKHLRSRKPSWTEALGHPLLRTAGHSSGGGTDQRAAPLRPDGTLPPGCNTASKTGWLCT